jgi:hypothetical protein
MNNTLHAPAPWAINRISRWHDGTPKDFDYLEVNSLEGYRVAFAWDCKPKSFATMNLIASAPDLLDALDWALRQIEDDLDPDHQAAFDAACSSLAKAKGVIE